MARTIPSEVLQMAGQGEVETLRRLARLLQPGNATKEVVNIIFKWVTVIPVPVSSTRMSEFVSSSGVGDRPSASLCAFWKLLVPVDHSELKPEVKLLLIEQLMESGDAVLGWTRVCLQSGLPTITEDMLNTGPFSPRAKKYLSVARMLGQLVRFDEIYAPVVLSSPAFLNLFLELWLAEDYRDHTGTLVFRMLDCRTEFGCPTLDIADMILSNERSREALLARCKNRKQREQFATALTDRAVRGWHHKEIPMLAWHFSLRHIVSVTHHPSTGSPQFRRQLARTGHATQLCTQLKDFVTGLLQTEDVKFLVSELISSLSTLVELALVGDTPSQVLNNWRQLVLGSFVEALWGATLVDAEIDGISGSDTLNSILGKLAQCMTHPSLFGERGFLEIPIENLNPKSKLISPWTGFLEAHSRSTGAFYALGDRPTVYFCDYLLCALSGEEPTSSSKKCSGCCSVVYCSKECQKKDWEEGHSQECEHARRVHEDQQETRTWYGHDTRASQACLLEIVYEGDRNNGEYKGCAAYPVFDCSSPEAALSIRKSVKTLAEGTPPSHEASLRPFPETRWVSLIEVYRSRAVPEGWRLAEGVFPSVFGDTISIHLLTLFKPIGNGFRTMYCVLRYSHDPYSPLNSTPSILDGSSAMSDS